MSLKKTHDRIRSRKATEKNITLQDRLQERAASSVLQGMDLPPQSGPAVPMGRWRAFGVALFAPPSQAPGGFEGGGVPPSPVREMENCHASGSF